LVAKDYATGGNGRQLNTRYFFGLVDPDADEACSTPRRPLEKQEVKLRIRTEKIPMRSSLPPLRRALLAAAVRSYPT